VRPLLSTMSDALPAMRGISRLLLVLAAVLAPGVTASPLAAQAILVNGDPQALTVSTTIAGFQPAAVTDGSTTYTLTAVINQKVVARLNTPLPVGDTLKVRLSGSTSLGDVILTTTDRDVLGTLSVGPHNGTITYTLKATMAASPVSTSVTVTISLVGS
jgi:hypothetical protein